MLLGVGKLAHIQRVRRQVEYCSQAGELRALDLTDGHVFVLLVVYSDPAEFCALSIQLALIRLSRSYLQLEVVFHF